MGKSEATDKARSAKVVRARTAWPLARGFSIISTPLREHKEKVCVGTQHLPVELWEGSSGC